MDDNQWYSKIITESGMTSITLEIKKPKPKVQANFGLIIADSHNVKTCDIWLNKAQVAELVQYLISEDDDA